MSGLFSRLDVITQSQYEAELSNPSPPFRGPTPSYLRPKVADLSDDDPDYVQAIPDITKKPTASDWLSRRTKKNIAEDKLKAKIEKMEEKVLEKETKLRVGDYVYCRSPLVAPLLTSKGPKGERRVREKLHGTIVKQCEHFPRFYQVNFINETSFFCTSNVLSFVSKSAPSSYTLTKTNKNQLSMVKRNKKIDNMEKVMKDILVSKVHKVPGYDLSYAALEALFKPSHSWITARKLSKHAKKIRNKLGSDVHTESWIYKLDKTDSKYPKHATTEKSIESPNSMSSNLNDDRTLQTVTYKSGSSRTSQTIMNIRKHCKKNKDPNVRRTYSFSSDDNIEIVNVDDSDTISNEAIGMFSILIFIYNWNIDIY